MGERDGTLGDVLRRLVDRGDLDEADLVHALETARSHRGESSIPGYLQPLIFLGALLAAGMIMVGVTTLFEIRFESGNMMVMGSVYLLAALVLHFSRAHEFTDYLGLSFSIGGHAFLIGAAADRSTENPELAVLFTALVLCAALYGLYRDPLHRFLSCLLVFVIAKFALPAADLGGALHGLVALLAIGCGGLVMGDRQRPLWRPLAYACGYGLPVILLPLSPRGLWFEDPELPRAWISSVVVGLGVLWVLRFALLRTRAAHPGCEVPMATRVVVVAVIGGLCALSAPGILAALFLVSLGYAAHHWQLVLLGLASLPIYIFKYYYNLELDLMAKSGVLMGSGVLLLLARWVVVRARFTVGGFQR